MPKLENLFEEYDKLYRIRNLIPMMEAYEQMDRIENKITKIRNKIKKLYIGDKTLA